MFLILVLVQIYLFAMVGGFVMVEKEVQTIVVVAGRVVGSKGFRFEFGFVDLVGGIFECVDSFVIVIVVVLRSRKTWVHAFFF